MLYSVVIDGITNNTLYQRFTGVSGRHHVKLMGFSFTQAGGSGSVVSVNCQQLGNNTSNFTNLISTEQIGTRQITYYNTQNTRTFLSFIVDLNAFDHHFGVIDLGVRELNNYLDFTFTGTTDNAARFILYLDINDAQTQYSLKEYSLLK